MYHESSLDNLCKISNQTKRTVLKHLEILQELNLLIKTNKGWYELVGNTRFKAITDSIGIDCVVVSTDLGKKDLRNLVKLAKIKIASESLEKHIIKQNSKLCKEKNRYSNSKISEKIRRTSLQGEEEAVSITIIPKAVSKVINSYNSISGFSQSSVRSTLLYSKKVGLISYKRKFSIKKCNKEFKEISKFFRHKDIILEQDCVSKTNLVLEFEQVGCVNKDNTLYIKKESESPLFLWRINNGVAIATEMTNEKVFNREIVNKSFNEEKYQKQIKKYSKIKYYASKKVLTAQDIEDRNIHFLKTKRK